MNNCLDRRCSPRTVRHAAFLFWPAVLVSPPLSARHFICAQHSRGRPLLVVFQLSLWVAGQTARAEEPLFRLFVPAVCWNHGSVLDALAGESDSAGGSRGVPTRRLRPTYMTQHAHWRLMQTWCRSVIDVCGMEWRVWISDPDYTAGFLRTRTDQLLLKEHLVCSDFEFYEFCLMLHFTLLSDGFAFDEAPDPLTIGSRSLISCHNAAFFAF